MSEQEKVLRNKQSVYDSVRGTSDAGKFASISAGLFNIAEQLAIMNDRAAEAKQYPDYLKKTAGGEQQAVCTCLGGPGKLFAHHHTCPLCPS